MGNSDTLKQKFHQLIDNVQDTESLLKFYEMMELQLSSANGKLWDDLSKDEQQELVQIDQQSEDDTLLIMHESQVQKFGKWLKK